MTPGLQVVIKPILRRPVGGPATDETMRQLRVAIRLAMRSLTIEQAAARAECHVNTLSRILCGRNVGVRTAARIVEALGSKLYIRLSE